MSYEVPTPAIAAIMLNPAFKKVVSGPEPIRAITEACRRAVAAELQKQINELHGLLVEAYPGSPLDLTQAIEHLRARQTELVNA